MITRTKFIAMELLCLETVNDNHISTTTFLQLTRIWVHIWKFFLFLLINIEETHHTLIYCLSYYLYILNFFYIPFIRLNLANKLSKDPPGSSSPTASNKAVSSFCGRSSSRQNTFCNNYIIFYYYIIFSYWVNSSLWSKFSSCIFS